MPSIKIPRKSADTDMTPFVDVAFLILSFFMLATKFKPPEPVEITTPNSVSTKDITDADALLVEFDQKGRVFFTVNQKKQTKDNNVKMQIIQNLNTTRNLGLTPAEMQNFARGGAIGVPFSQLKSLLKNDPIEQAKISQPGIPVKDSASNELYYWVRDAVSVFKGSRLNYFVKGDNGAKYPDFKRVLEAFKRNDIYKFQLVTSPEEAPAGTELDKERRNPKKS